MSSVIVSELAIYPVKSMAQIVVNESRVDNFGLHNDRRWMVVDANGRFLTQRQQPRMCLIKVALQSNSIILTAPQMPPLTVQLPTQKPTTTVTLWQDQCLAIDCNDEVANWLTQFLAVQCRLVYFHDDEVRQVDQTFAEPNDKTAFSDGFPILLISQASLDNLNNKLDVAVPMKRFRPNIVVTGCNAFDEDTWKLIRIGELTLRVVKPCSRCVIPSIDTATGDKGAEPTATLLTFRKQDNKIYFGQNLIANSQGNLAVRDSVEILEFF